MPVDALTATIIAGDVPAAEALLREHPRLSLGHDGRGIPVLLLATYHGQAEIAALIRAARQRLGNPLEVHEAAAAGEPSELAAALRAAPVLRNTWTADGFTALHLAAFFGRTENVRLLLEQGADPRAVAHNPSRVQPLHSAAAASAFEIARLLVAAGADARAVQEGGWTPLHAAAANGHEPLARLLLEAGADAHAQLDDGRTPVDLARQRKHESIAALLESVRAQTG
jgi:hypothetical protein